MKSRIGLLTLVTLATATGGFLFGQDNAVTNGPSGTKWKLAWADEFEGAGPPNPARWTNEAGFVRNREAQYYTTARPENARVENGRLIIEARKEKFPNARHTPGSGDWRHVEHAEYTSASLTTRGLGGRRHGLTRASFRGGWKNPPMPYGRNR